jgi:intracellular sulfur oxidation DsrE/DsrF family protein
MKVLRTVVIAALALAMAAGVAVVATSPEAFAQVKKTAQRAMSGKVHKLAIQVNQNEKAVMDLALNNAKNVIDYYKSKNEQVQIELVTFGPGLHMLRSESPVKERVAQMSLENPNLIFQACANTQANMSKAEGKPVTLLGEAKITPSGVVRIMELQDEGYAYLRP